VFMSDIGDSEILRGVRPLSIVQASFLTILKTVFSAVEGRYFLIFSFVLSSSERVPPGGCGKCP